MAEVTKHRKKKMVKKSDRCKRKENETRNGGKNGTGRERKKIRRN